MKFDPPFDRRKPDIDTAAPFGQSPDRQWIVSTEGLPPPPIPKHLQVTKDSIDIDGWVVFWSCVSKGLRVWL